MVPRTRSLKPGQVELMLHRRCGSDGDGLAVHPKPHIVSGIRQSNLQKSALASFNFGFVLHRIILLNKCVFDVGSERYSQCHHNTMALA
jgi:hypothetical protein